METVFRNESATQKGGDAMPVSIKELSKYCGCSPSAVSKALNGYPDIGEETRTRVLAAAKELGYQPSAIAKGLKTGRTYNIGVLYNEMSGTGLTHGYFSPVLEAFKAETERRGYDITFLSQSLRSGKQQQMSYLQHSRYRNVDGVCIFCCDFYEDQVRELVDSHLPVATIDHPFDGHSCVASANVDGIRALTQYVIDCGHRRIAFIHGESAQATHERLAGFLETMQINGLSILPEYLVEAPYHNPTPTREATARLLRLSNRPTCILMPDDYAALGGMDAITAAGLSIPGDVSVTGFDGIPLMQLRKPCLTTVSQDTASIGREAARQLIHQIERREDFEPRRITIPTRLITGDTVAPLSNG